MSRNEVLSCPVGEISDMIACQQIANGAKQKVYADIDDLMKVR